MEVKRKREKQKLTLGVDKEVIERAKATGINISAITEELLKSVTYEPKGKGERDVMIAYENLFKFMEPLVRKYDLEVEVGRYDIYPDIDGFKESDDDAYGKVCINMASYGTPESPSLTTVIYDINGNIVTYYQDSEVAQHLDSLYEPKTILQNLIVELVGKAEKNNQKIRELKLAKQFVELLLSEIENVQDKI